MTRPVFSCAGLAALLLLSACSSDDHPAPAPVVDTPTPPVVVTNPPVAFMTDVHFENVYGDFKSTAFSGIPTKDGKNATIRTMYAQLTSTRLFNENYFAFRHCLALTRGAQFSIQARAGAAPALEFLPLY